MQPCPAQGVAVLAAVPAGCQSAFPRAGWHSLLWPPQLVPPTARTRSPFAYCYLRARASLAVGRPATGNTWGVSGPTQSVELLGGDRAWFAEPPVGEPRAPPSPARGRPGLPAVLGARPSAGRSFQGPHRPGPAAQPAAAVGSAPLSCPSRVFEVQKWSLFPMTT